MDTILTILSYVGALLIVGIIIMVHELGHYSIGRVCKIKIVEFAVGFGPKIKKWVKNDIIYSIRSIPLGGFTKFYGEDENLNDKDAFNNQPPGRRALTIAAGPVYNIIFAFLFAIIVLISFGDYVPVVVEVWTDSPAQMEGLQVGDVITEMDGVDIDFLMETAAAQRAANDEYLAITVLRDGEELSFDIPRQYYEPQGDETTGSYLAGFKYGGQHAAFGFFEAIGLSFKWTFSAVKETFVGVVGLFSGLFVGQVPEGAMGIGRIVKELGEAIRQNFIYLMQLCAAINISLAVFNLLPLPALDGGRLVFIGIEKVFRRPVPRNVEGMIHFVGFILLFGVMIFFLFHDFAGFFSGG